MGIDHENKIAGSSIVQAPNVCTGSKGAKQRERKKQRVGEKQSPPVLLAEVQLSSLKQSGIKEATERNLEFPPVLVSPKFLQHHSLANQKSLKQLSNSSIATTVTDVGKCGRRIAIAGPTVKEIEAKSQESFYRSQIGTNTKSLDVDSEAESYNYDQGLDHDVSSHQQVSSLVQGT